MVAVFVVDAWGYRLALAGTHFGWFGMIRVKHIGFCGFVAFSASNAVLTHEPREIRTNLVYFATVICIYYL